jgi:hypothetical protein
LTIRQLSASQPPPVVLHRCHTPPLAPWAKTSPFLRRRRSCSPAARPPARRRGWHS